MLVEGKRLKICDTRLSYSLMSDRAHISTCSCVEWAGSETVENTLPCY